MTIKIMDGKKERVFTVNSHHRDGSPVDFNDPEHRKRLSEASVKAFEACGYERDREHEIGR